MRVQIRQTTGVFHEENEGKRATVRLRRVRVSETVIMGERVILPGVVLAQ